ncbi:MAG: methionyl-tRNA formyltransferase [Allosphingosinicella sp.]
MARIVIATPHSRYRTLVERLGARDDMEVLHITAPDQLDPDRLARFQPDYVFFPHWSWKIPPEVHDRLEAVIFHMTDVPYGRGGSPLQNLIRRGHKETRLSALKCVEAFDAGPVYLKRPMSLDGTAEEIFARAAALMEEMIVEIVTNRPQPQPQAGEPVVFQRLRPQDGDLRRARTAEEVYDMIRMLDADGYPPAFLEADGIKVEFSRASLVGGEVAATARFRRTDAA